MTDKQPVPEPVPAPVVEAPIPATEPERVATPLVSIDPPLVDYSHPGFEFAGTTIAGENAMVCLACGCVVKSSHEVRHVNWHA